MCQLFSQLVVQLFLNSILIFYIEVKLSLGCEYIRIYLIGLGVGRSPKAKMPKKHSCLLRYSKVGGETDIARFYIKMTPRKVFVCLFLFLFWLSEKSSDHNLIAWTSTSWHKSCY